MSLISEFLEEYDFEAEGSFDRAADKEELRAITETVLRCYAATLADIVEALPHGKQCALATSHHAAYSENDVNVCARCQLMEALQ